MKIELIPVIEITNYDQDVPMPPSSPYWKFPDEWENYNISACLQAGFSKELKSYFKSSSFYRINEITNADLLKIIQKEMTERQTNEDPEIEDVMCPLVGGYILKIDNIDKYFPQCCADLSDIKEWDNLISEEDSYFYMGHPSPRIEKTENKIVFDFLNSAIQENYVPPILEDRIEVDKITLKTAIENAKIELDHFAYQLREINLSENLNIPQIDKILIYGIDE